MPIFLRDLATVMEAAGLGVYGETLFIGNVASMPTNSDGPLYRIKGTPGLPALPTHNDLTSPRLMRPGFQVSVIARKKTDAQEAARQSYLTLYGIRNQFIGEIWYLSVIPTQEPFDFPPDAQNRPVSGFNGIATKLPSFSGGGLVAYYLIDDLGGDRNEFQRPSVADSYPSGSDYDVLVPGSAIIVLSALPTGALVLEASGRVDGAGGRVKVALFNLNSDTPVTNGEIAFTANQTAGERVRSSALSLQAGIPYGLKMTTDNTGVGGAIWNARIMHL